LKIRVLTNRDIKFASVAVLIAISAAEWLIEEGAILVAGT
jgi:hypothetical protein